MKKSDALAAVSILREILGKVEMGSLKAPQRVVARLEGAILGVEAAATSRARAAKSGRLHDGLDQ
jgi:hypothetical protein